MNAGNSMIMTAGELRELRADIEDFHSAYCAMLDEGHLDQWPDHFTEDAIYRVTSRENFDAGLPAGLVYAEGRTMLRDRAYAIGNTQMFAPRTVLHYVANVRVLGAEGGCVVARANYLLLQTLIEGPTTLHQAGCYHDVFVRRAGRLLLRERQCVYDTALVANDLVYPV
ncbi:aromatic-ring-hydroxylating dioxygenase subunit beta [Pigmentiphaga sp.]|uniref:aromatic-ring-hydroxylating dioxygenase subunit beta n=1 Tax=Pigmentiphaga sp. TaxID=1977564 RepID=UPI0025CEB4CA|nr:aromatic-ring-hydroxylating dioxygenase subunit beta [Pigmentiphaga sp.]